MYIRFTTTRCTPSFNGKSHSHLIQFFDLYIVERMYGNAIQMPVHHELVHQITIT